MKKLNYKKISDFKANFLYLLLPLKIEAMLLQKLIENFNIVNFVFNILLF